MDEQPRKRRLQTATERETASLVALKERDSRAPEFVAEECTGVLEGEDLRLARSKRTTADRVDRLEDKSDKLHEAVSQTTVSVGVLAVKVDTLVEESRAARADAADAKKNHRERVTAIVKSVLGGGAAIEILHRLFL